MVRESSESFSGQLVDRSRTDASIPSSGFVRSTAAVQAFICVLVAASGLGPHAQEHEPLPPKRDSTTAYPNTTRASSPREHGLRRHQDAARLALNISVYGLFRYMNQYPVGDSFTDHLGHVRPVQPTQ